jgi:hypothetical protein
MFERAGRSLFHGLVDGACHIQACFNRHCDVIQISRQCLLHLYHALGAHIIEPDDGIVKTEKQGEYYRHR